MQSHDEGPYSDVIGKPGEAEENDGGHMVDDLFLKILQKRSRLQGTLPCSLFPISQRLCPEIPRDDRKGSPSQGLIWALDLTASLSTHLSLDVGGNAEEQGPVEGEFNNVIPILRRDDALREERGVRDSRTTGSKGLTSKLIPSSPSRYSVLWLISVPWISRNSIMGVTCCRPLLSYLYGISLPNFPQVIEPGFLQREIKGKTQTLWPQPILTKDAPTSQYSHPQ